MRRITITLQARNLPTRWACEETQERVVNALVYGTAKEALETALACDLRVVNVAVSEWQEAKP